MYVCQTGEEHLCLTSANGRRQVLPNTSSAGRGLSPDGSRSRLSLGWVGCRYLGAGCCQRGLTRLRRVRALQNRVLWSPDGNNWSRRRAKRKHDAYSVVLDVFIIRRLTTHTAQDSDAAWSPDGRQIAFVSRRDGNYELYVMNTDGQNVRRLTQHPGEDLAPVWSPDGNKLVYECEADAGSDKEICVIASQGGQPQQLTHNTMDDRQPTWSPDGQQIAFCRERAAGTAWDIWVMNADGAQQRVWVKDDAFNTHPSWKP